MPVEPTAARAASVGGDGAIPFRFEGRAFVGREGDTLASALWRASVRVLRQGAGPDGARGLFCGVGHCCECRVVVAGVAGARACLLALRPGLEAWREPVLDRGSQA